MAKASGDVLKWLAALLLLWLILTAMKESGPLSQVAAPMAGLILAGALFYMGPTAIKNVQAIKW